MRTRYPIYKGLQQPLIYRGFKGKFIYWGVGSLVAGLITGGVTVALVNMYLGAFMTIAIIAAGWVCIFFKQKAGLYSKQRSPGILVYPTRIIFRYENGKRPFSTSLRRN